MSGDRANRLRQLSELLEGYEEFCEFNGGELRLIESLRAECAGYSNEFTFSFQVS